jgi:hypothetical protein
MFLVCGMSRGIRVSRDEPSFRQFRTCAQQKEQQLALRRLHQVSFALYMAHNGVK